jgi:hypothetical protein
MLLTELAAKGLEVMTESLPQVRRIGILWNPTTPSHPRALKAIEAAAEKLGIELRIVLALAQTLEDFDGAFFHDDPGGCWRPSCRGIAPHCRSGRASGGIRTQAPATGHVPIQRECRGGWSD